MTPAQIKVGGSLLVLFVGWLLGRKTAPTGDVELGTPTVSGSGSDSFGGQDYGTTPVILPDGERFAQDDEMNRLIIESNAAIAEAGGLP